MTKIKLWSAVGCAAATVAVTTLATGEINLSGSVAFGVLLCRICLKSFVSNIVAWYFLSIGCSGKIGLLCLNCEVCLKPGAPCLPCCCCGPVSTFHFAMYPTEAFGMGYYVYYLPTSPDTATTAYLRTCTRTDFIICPSLISNEHSAVLVYILQKCECDGCSVLNVQLHGLCGVITAAIPCNEEVPLTLNVLGCNLYPKCGCCVTIGDVRGEGMCR